MICGMSKVLRYIGRPVVMVLMAFSLGASQAAVWAEDDVRGDLGLFRKKVAEKEAERSPQMRGDGQFSMQLQQIEMLLTQKKYDRVQTQLGNIGGYGLPVEF